MSGSDKYYERLKEKHRKEEGLPIAEPGKPVGYECPFCHEHRMVTLSESQREKARQYYQKIVAGPGPYSLDNVMADPHRGVVEGKDVYHKVMLKVMRDMTVRAMIPPEHVAKELTRRTAGP